MSENYRERINESKDSLSEAIIYVFQKLKSLDERIKDLEGKIAPKK